MKIIRIFAEVDDFFVFQYPNESDHEYNRLMDLWTNVSYLRAFALNNNISDIDNFVSDIEEAVEKIENIFERINNLQSSAKQYFQPLVNTDTNQNTPIQKNKFKTKNLRLYALKIEDCFVITGGAIKISQTMQEHPDTKAELLKLEQCKTYLKSNNVFDTDSFYELLFDNYDE